MNQIITADDDQKPRKELIEELSRLRGQLATERNRRQEFDQALTENQKVEIALRDSEERFRSFMDNSPTIAWLKDDQGRYVYISKTALARHNRVVDEIINKTDAEIFDVGTAKKFSRNDQEVIGAGRALFFSEEVVHANGELSYWLNSKFPFQDSSGHQFVGGIGLEITRLKKMEEALKESEQRYRALFEYSQDAVLLTFPDGTIEAANTAACAMFDCSEEEIRAMGRSGILDTGDPRIAVALQERQQKGWIKSVELTAIRKGGESFPAEVDSVILPGEPARSFIILRDITERKHAEEALQRSEERLHLATEATELAVFEWDLASDRVTGNDWFRWQFGLGPDEPILGAHIIQEGIDPADQELTNQHLRCAMDPASPGRFAFEFRLAKADGRGERWILTHGQVYFEGTGNDRRTVRVLGTNLDITERKIAEEALQESIQELNEYNYALVHNIKAPFRAVKNYASFLVEDLAESLQGQPKQCIDGLQKAVDEANRQFRDLEALYRIRSHTVEYEPLDVREVLDEIASVHQTSTDRQLVIAEQQWPTIRGERFLLRQILSELINNGFKYNRSEMKKVEIACHENADKRLEIVISDNGIGIDSQYHEHIFHIFKRLHTEKEYEGTGIGLAIVRRAVKRLGGELRIESAVGQGTTFVISLPAAVVEDDSRAWSFGAADTPG